MFSNETSRHIEAQPPKEQEVVRVLLLSMAKPFEILPQQASPKASDIWFTRSHWLIKGENSENKDQVMLPGGRIYTDVENPETPIEAATRKLREEGNTTLVDMGEDDVVVSSRSYTFTHSTQGKIKNYETIYVGRVAPTSRPRAADPKDKALGIVAFNPLQNETFLRDERIPHTEWDLIENMRTVSPTEVERDKDEADSLKEKLVDEAYRYEMGIRIKVLKRLITGEDTEGEELQQIIESIEEQNNRGIGNLKERIEYINSVFANLARVEADQDLPDEFVAKLKIATEEVYFGECMSFRSRIEQQNPLLRGKAFVDLSTITPFEIGLIREHNPEFYAMLKSINDAFDPTGFPAELESPDWYERMLSNLKHYQTMKSTSRGIHNKFFTDAVEARLYENFGINPGSFGAAARQFNRHLKYLHEPSKNLVEKDTAAKLYSDQLHVGTERLEELVLVMFGISPYDQDVQMPPSFRWQAVRKIISTLQWRQFFTKHNPDRAQSRYQFRLSIMNLIGDLGQYENYPLWGEEDEDSIKIKPHPRSSIGASTDMYMSINDKKDESVFRKYMESGEVLDDVGIALIIDGAADPRYAAWWLMWDLFGDFKKFASPGKFRISNARQGGILQGLLVEMAEAGVLQLEDKNALESSHIGKASSPRWSWVKFVAYIDGVPCEFQLFPSLKDFNSKKDDDPRYHLERSTKPQIDGSVSLLDLYNYNVDEGAWHEYMKAVHSV